MRERRGDRGGREKAGVAFLSFKVADAVAEPAGRSSVRRYRTGYLDVAWRLITSVIPLDRQICSNGCHRDCLYPRCTLVAEPCLLSHDAIKPAPEEGSSTSGQPAWCISRVHEVGDRHRRQCRDREPRLASTAATLASVVEQSCLPSSKLEHAPRACAFLSKVTHCP